MTSATNAQDVIAVLNSSFAQVFERARAIKLNISREAQAMKHPLETGAEVTDHRIIMPVGAELSMILSSADYRAVYQQIADLFKRGELLIVQTRVESFPSMLITKMPHEESSDMIDGIALALTLEEAQFVAAQYSALPPKKVKKPKDSDTAKRGEQQPKEVNRSVLSGWFK